MSNDANKSLVNKKEEGGYSSTDEHSIVYKWEINKITPFLMSAKNAEKVVYLKSPEFSTDAKIKDLWNLEVISIENDDDKTKNELSIYLFPRNGDQKVRTNYLLFILNNKKEKILFDLIAYNTLDDCYRVHHLFDGSRHGRGYAKCVEIDKLLKKKDELFQNDTLTVCVELTVYDEYIAVKNSNNLLEGFERKLSDDFKDLFNAKKKCDIIIKVGDQKFDAHKFILTARSCVFEAMFSHDMKENKENEVTIPDIDPEIFKKVLDYIYTDKVDDLIRFAEELLEAADKYQLLGLKELCECSLSKSLTPENAVSILILADRHNAKRLEGVAISFMANNWIKFKNTEEFKQLEKSHLALAYAVLRKIVY